MQGNRPYPTVVRMMNNAGKRARPTNEPDPEYLKDLTPPPSLPESAKDIWIDLAPKLSENRLLTVVDTIKFENLCRAVAEFRWSADLVEKLKDSGKLPVTNSLGGAVVYHPAYVMRNRAWDQVKELAREFGMTPAARSKIRVNPQIDALNNSLESLLMGWADAS